MKSIGLIARLVCVVRARSRPHFKEGAKSLVARTTAKRAGKRVGFERGGGHPDVTVG
jgi:hypothetical protein